MRYVHEDHVGGRSRHGRQRLGPVAALGYHQEPLVLGQDALHSGSDERLVIDQDNRDHRTTAGRSSTAAGRGTRARTNQPRAAGPAWRVPPTASTRSRMPIRPTPAGPLAVAAPRLLA